VEESWGRKLQSKLLKTWAVNIKVLDCKQWEGIVKSACLRVKRDSREKTRGETRKMKLFGLLVLAWTSTAAAKDILEENTKYEAGELAPYALPLASPERSSVDEENFNMAASYLKSQFSIPHHLVPSYQDTASSSTVNWFPGGPDSAEDRVRRLPNIQNHQLDTDSYPDSSYNYDYEYIDTSNEFQLDEDRRYKRRPDLDYTWGQELEPGQKVYRKEKPKARQIKTTTRKPHRSKKRPQQRPKQINNKPRFPRNPIQFQNTGPRIRPVPQNLNLLAMMTSRLRNGLSSALTGNRRATFPFGIQPGYLRKQYPRRKSYPVSMPSPDYEDYYDNLITEEPVHNPPGSRVKSRLQQNKNQVSKLATRPSQGFPTIDFSKRPKQIRNQNKRFRGDKKNKEQAKHKRMRKRKFGQTPRVYRNQTQNKHKNNKKVSLHSNGNEQQESTRREDTEQNKTINEEEVKLNTFDGLDMEFWEEDLEQTTKPDYRKRWQYLNKSEQNEEENKYVVEDENIADEEHVGSRRVSASEIKNKDENTIKEKDSKEDGNIGWGEKMWNEIENDWNKDGEKWKKHRVRKRKNEQINDEPEVEIKESNVQNEPSIVDGARYLSAWADAGEIMEIREKGTQFLEEKSLIEDKYKEIHFKPSEPYNEDMSVKGKSANQKKRIHHTSLYDDKVMPVKSVKPIKSRPTRRFRTRTLQDRRFRQR